MAGGNGKSSGSRKTTSKARVGNKGEAATLARQDAFLDVFRLTGNITKSAELSDINRRTVYDWRENPDFEQRFKDSYEESNDHVRAEIHRRAVTGYEDQIVYRGELTGASVTKYSDRMLELEANIRGFVKRGDRFGNQVDDSVPASDEEFL